jgi:hypothetical protein
MSTRRELKLLDIERDLPLDDSAITEIGERVVENLKTLRYRKSGKVKILISVVYE